jgi:hypothetical protein
MGWFEENPLALIGLIIVTVEAWTLVKRTIARVLRGRRSQQA